MGRACEDCRALREPPKDGLCLLGWGMLQGGGRRSWTLVLCRLAGLSDGQGHCQMARYPSLDPRQKSPLETVLGS